MQREARSQKPFVISQKSEAVETYRTRERSETPNPLW
jgi:hypothetical protein